MKAWVLSAALATFPSWTLAQKPAKPAPRVPEVMTRAQLLECMKRNDSLYERMQAHVKAEERHIAFGAEVTDEARVLAEQLRGLDRYNRSDVDKYNEVFQAHDKKIVEHNHRSDELNAAGERLKLEKAKHMEDCGTKVYNLAEERAILKEGTAKRSLSRP